MLNPEVIGSFVIPAALWALMFIVGLDLTLADFQRVALFPGKVTLAIACQLVTIPAIAYMLIISLKPTPEVIAGLIILAAVPAGATSNFFTYLGRANVGLSVTLTAISGVIALITMPILIETGFVIIMGQSGAEAISKLTLALQLIVYFVFPVICGMGLRHMKPSLIARYRVAARNTSIAIIVFVILVILTQNLDKLAGGFGDTFLIAIVFSVLVMATGWLTGRLTGMPRDDRLALIFEFGTRNFALVAIVGITVFKNDALLLLPTIFFIVQIPLVALVLWLFRENAAE